MTWRAAIAGVFLLAFGGASVTGAMACEGYVELSMQDAKEYRDKLQEQGADPLDRMFAFQQLVCSSNPILRAYAVREGLKAANDPLVRQQIMFDSLMQKTRLEIEMTAGSKATKADKAFIKELSGIWVLEVRYASREHGCLSFDRYDGCKKARALFIRGDNVEFSYNNAIGEFFLSDSNELVGFVRVNGRSDYSRIPAVIKLN